MVDIDMDLDRQALDADPKPQHRVGGGIIVRKKVTRNNMITFSDLNG